MNVEYGKMRNVIKTARKLVMETTVKTLVPLEGIISREESDGLMGLCSVHNELLDCVEILVDNLEERDKALDQIMSATAEIYALAVTKE